MTTPNDTTPKCPACGGAQGYVTNDRASGWVEYHGIGWDGTEERTNGEDGLRYTRSRTVECLDCGRRVARPDGAP